MNGSATAFGGAGNDTFFNNPGGTMTVVEGPGHDAVLFGSGPTTVFGGSGTDLYDFVQGSGGGADVIAGFKPGTDQVQLFGYSNVQQASVGGNTVITLGDGTSITLLAANSIV
jgi:hypothetical protein